MIDLLVEVAALEITEANAKYSKSVDGARRYPIGARLFERNLRERVLRDTLWKHRETLAKLLADEVAA